MFQRSSGFRWLIVALAGIFVASLVTWVVWPADSSAAQTKRQFTVSYAGAASRLDGLPPLETTEQVRDWARIGLASHLEMETAALRDALYDTFPVRDTGFADLARQSTGPGRALPDGKGVLHLLIPRDDPHEERTAGLLLDQHRTDVEHDPTRVQVHRYTIHSQGRTIEIVSDDAVRTADFRTDNGYVTARIDDEKGLADFLARAPHLSMVEVRGDNVWAGGWDWPGQKLSHTDVSVLQRGYQQAYQQGPGFSLDPGPQETKADLLAVLPGLRPDLAGRALSGDWSGTAFGTVLKLERTLMAALHGDVASDELEKQGLPTDRTELWKLRSVILGGAAYSEARYDGGLQGTEIGMTLFYTDLITKQWATGVGTSVPAKAVEGFEPDPDAATPWSHCAANTDPVNETGRLWFGQNDSAFSFSGNRVSLGAQSTRLFARSDSTGGGEVEPTYSAGRGLQWWDQNYQAVADYEPQYERLDQIMRWSGALEWLAKTEGQRLPQLDNSAIESGLRFADWYEHRADLKERGDIRFVSPPSATQEALMAQPSRSFENCGRNWIMGGVSLADRDARTGEHNYHATVPEPLRRAGLRDEQSTFDHATGTGTITELTVDASGKVVDSVERAFAMADGKAQVGHVATGKRVIPFGGLKVMRAETTTRQLRVEMRGERGQVSQQLTYQGHDMGGVTTEKTVSVVTLTWRRGLVDRVRAVLEPMQRGKSARDGVLYSQQRPDGQLLHRVGGPADPWLSISVDSGALGSELVFRLGSPDPKSGLARHFMAKFAPRPPPGGQWMELVRQGADAAPVVKFVESLPTDTTPIRVRTPEGNSTTLHRSGDRVLARTDDPVVGISGSVEGAALLRDLAGVLDKVGTPTRAEDRLLRAVRLGDDGVAMAAANELIVVAADHPWSARVQAALGPDLNRVVHMRISDDRAVHVDLSELERRSTEQSVPLRELIASPNTVVFLHESFRSSLSVKDGPVVTDALPQDTLVTVREMTTVTQNAVASQPDVRVYRDAEWLRVDAPLRIVASSSGDNRTVTSAPPTSSTSPTAPPTPRATPPVPAPRIVLVCPDDEDSLAGCGD